MEQQIDESSAAQRSSFYKQVTKAKQDMKELLKSDEHSETVRVSVLGFSPTPRMLIPEVKPEKEEPNQTSDKLQMIQHVSTD